MSAIADKNARDAIERYEALYKNPRTGEFIIDTDEAEVAYVLAEALRSYLPKYAVMFEDEHGGGQRIAKSGFESVAEAQAWIAAEDPAARRVVTIREQAR